MRAIPKMPTTADEVQALFVEELGWDLASGAYSIPLIVPGQIRRGWLSRDERELRDRLRHHSFLLQRVARKQGSTVFVCTCPSWDELPAFNYRLRLHYNCRKWSPSPLVFYPSPDGTAGLWQWAERPEDGELPFEHRVEGDSEWALWRGELNGLAFSMDDEMRGVTAAEVARRLREAFWIDRPKRQYTHEAFEPERYRAYGDGLYRLALFADAQEWPDWEEERTLGRLAREGRDWARARLFNAHLRVALEHARKVPAKRYTGGLEMDDLVSACLWGLQTSVERYDPERDVRLQSYASIWIRRYAGRLVCTDARLIDLPVHVFTGLDAAHRGYDRAWDRLAQATNGVPSDRDVLRTLTLTSSERRAWPLYRQIHGHAGNFDDQANPEAFSYEPFADLDDPRMHAIRARIAELPQREAEVIRLRYLSGDEPGGTRLTLEEVAERIGISRERVRQVEMNALKRLRGQKPMKAYSRRTDPIGVEALSA